MLAIPEGDCNKPRWEDMESEKEGDAEEAEGGAGGESASGLEG